MRVFLSSPWIPAEWIRAHQLETRSLGMEDNDPEGAPLSAGVCAFAERAVRLAKTQADAAVIFATSCDQLRRAFDSATLRQGQPPHPEPGWGRSVTTLAKPVDSRLRGRAVPAPVQGGNVRILSGNFHPGPLPRGDSPCQGEARAFLFNLPATHTGVAKQIYRAEVERLGRFLVELGGTPPTAEQLGREMRETDDARRRLREATLHASARARAEAMARFHQDGIYRQPKGPPLKKGVPVALIGGPLPAANWNLFDAIESAGGRVELNGTENGERSLEVRSSVPERDAPSAKIGNIEHPTEDSNHTVSNLLEALVEGYWENITDVFQRPNTRLYAWLKAQLAARPVRGLVLWHFTGCDLWRAEAQRLREVFGLPVLMLEAGAEAGISPREANRLQAFMETLK